MASHQFIPPKPHRRLPAEDRLLRRVSDVAYVLAVTASHLVWDAVEDGVSRIFQRMRKRH